MWFWYLPSNTSVVTYLSLTITLSQDRLFGGVAAAYFWYLIKTDVRMIITWYEMNIYNMFLIHGLSNIRQVLCRVLVSIVLCFTEHDF